jgi:hypothetical protein
MRREIVSHKTGKLASPVSTAGTSTMSSAPEPDAPQLVSGDALADASWTAACVLFKLICQLPDVYPGTYRDLERNLVSQVLRQRMAGVAALSQSCTRPGRATKARSKGLELLAI